MPGKAVSEEEASHSCDLDCLSFIFRKPSDSLLKSPPELDTESAMIEVVAPSLMIHGT